MRGWLKKYQKKLWDCRLQKSLWNMPLTRFFWGLIARYGTYDKTSCFLIFLRALQSEHSSCLVWSSPQRSANLYVCVCVYYGPIKFLKWKFNGDKGRGGYANNFYLSLFAVLWPPQVDVHNFRIFIILRWSCAWVITLQVNK